MCRRLNLSLADECCRREKTNEDVNARHAGVAGTAFHSHNPLPPIMDVRFFFMFGRAIQRINQTEEIVEPSCHSSQAKGYEFVTDKVSSNVTCNM